MKLTKEQLSLSFFDSQCEKYGFEKKYLRYLNHGMIEFVLVICCIRLSRSQLIDFLNEGKNLYHKYTPHYFDKRITTIRRQLYSLKNHAEIFGIDKTIVELSADQLHDLVDEYYNKEK